MNRRTDLLGDLLSQVHDALNASGAIGYDRISTL